MRKEAHVKGSGPGEGKRVQRVVVFGALGVKSNRRNSKWRPSVSLCTPKEDGGAGMHVDRIEFFYNVDEIQTKTHEGWAKLRKELAEDIKALSPKIEVRFHRVNLGQDPFDFEHVCEGLFTLFQSYRFDPTNDYYFHLATGTQAVQVSAFVLVKAEVFRGRLLQSWGKDSSPLGAGYKEVASLDVSKFIHIQAHKREGTTPEEQLKNGIGTRNPSYNQMIREIERVALHSEDPILLQGPTGAGKTELAKRIYEQRKRKQRPEVEFPFVNVNCATLGETAASALFGHEKGAFTGAVSKHIGYLKEAGGGILFLDEVSELDTQIQASLLKAVEEKTYRPVGAEKDETSTFQLICGTNKDLRREVAEGRFRRDLMERIDMWTWTLPGLCERHEDIEPNLDYELKKIFKEKKTFEVRMDSEARKRFLLFAEAAPWPGNFREFSKSLRRMAALAGENPIGTSQVEAETHRLKETWKKDGDRTASQAPIATVCRPENPDDAEALLRALLTREQLTALDRIEHVTLAEVVRVCRGSRSLADAGRTLYNVSGDGKNPSDRLRKFLKRHHLDFHALSQGTGYTC